MNLLLLLDIITLFWLCRSRVKRGHNCVYLELISLKLVLFAVLQVIICRMYYVQDVINTFDPHISYLHGWCIFKINYYWRICHKTFSKPLSGGSSINNVSCSLLKQCCMLQYETIKFIIKKTTTVMFLNFNKQHVLIFFTLSY